MDFKHFLNGKSVALVYKFNINVDNKNLLKSIDRKIFSCLGSSTKDFYIHVDNH